MEKRERGRRNYSSPLLPIPHSLFPAPYEPVEPTLLPTVVNVWLALEPSVLMAVMQTTTIRASMTAYSTAVGPSSARTGRGARIPRAGHVGNVPHDGRNATIGRPAPNRRCGRVLRGHPQYRLRAPRRFSTHLKR